MAMDRINSDESEGLFEDFMDEQIADQVEKVLSEGEATRGAGHGTDIVIEMDDITPPSFIYGEAGGGAGGAGPGEPGREGGKLRFALPFQRFMELVARRLKLPDLRKEGRGRIKELSEEFKTFGPTGVVLDKRRTFKRALRTSVAGGDFDPAAGRNVVTIRRRDRRYKQPQRVERPRFKAACFYIGDISYSTLGERLEMEKRLLGFVHLWLDYSYGLGKVEHRFFVHDVQAYEVSADEFYRVSNIGGTEAAPAFELAARVARNEYDPETTNLYAFYVGDGELMAADAERIVELIGEELRPVFNRLCVIEMKPGMSSRLVEAVNRDYAGDGVVRALVVRRRQDIVPAIQRMFGVESAQHR